MKQLIIYLSLVFFCIVLFSCQQDAEVFSCNKDANDWAKENLAEIRQMDRSDWLNLDESLNRAAYVAFTSEQKFLFWKEKMMEVLTLNWNEAEKEHIQLLYETISNNPRWFSTDLSKNEEESEKCEIFTYKWIEYAKDNLGWDKSIIGPIIASGNKMLDTKGTLKVNASTTIRLKSSSEDVLNSDCGCSTSSDYCGGTKKCESGFTCNRVPRCGFLWLYTCDGQCT